MGPDASHQRVLSLHGRIQQGDLGSAFKRLACSALMRRHAASCMGASKRDDAARVSHVRMLVSDRASRSFRTSVDTRIRSKSFAVQLD